MDDWPFADPENVAVMTVRQVTHDGDPRCHTVSFAHWLCWFS
jgi:hypothetical protein